MAQISYLSRMALGFPQKTKTVDVTWIDKQIIVIGKDRYHHHDSEMQEIKWLLKKILKKIEPPTQDPEMQKLYDTLLKINEDIKTTV